MELDGKHVVVTGGASGIGKAMCERFHAEGAARIMIVDPAADAAIEVAESVGGTAHVCDLDPVAQEWVHRKTRISNGGSAACDASGARSAVGPRATTADRVDGSPGQPP